MHFLVEHQTDDDVRFALCETLGDVQMIAEDLVGEEGRLAELRLAPEGELSGEWGVLRYAPAA